MDWPISRELRSPTTPPLHINKLQNVFILLLFNLNYEYLRRDHKGTTFPY
jgi:hypothetical protein